MTAPALESLSRSTLERAIGFLTPSPEIGPGHTAHLLQPLAGAGGLYLTCAGALAEVRPGATPETLRVRLFRGSPESAWDAIQAQLPEIRLGVMRRFRVVREATDSASTPLYGVLDLATLDVLERGTDPTAIRLRAARANATCDGYLQEIRQERAREIARAALDAAGIRGGEPQW